MGYRCIPLHKKYLDVVYHCQHDHQLVLIVWTKLQSHFVSDQILTRTSGTLEVMVPRQCAPACTARNVTLRCSPIATIRMCFGNALCRTTHGTLPRAPRSFLTSLAWNREYCPPCLAPRGPPPSSGRTPQGVFRVHVSVPCLSPWSPRPNLRRLVPPSSSRIPNQLSLSPRYRSLVSCLVSRSPAQQSTVHVDGSLQINHSVPFNNRLMEILFNCHPHPGPSFSQPIHELHNAFSTNFYRARSSFNTRNSCLVGIVALLPDHRIRSVVGLTTSAAACADDDCVRCSAT